MAVADPKFEELLSARFDDRSCEQLLGLLREVEPDGAEGLAVLGAAAKGALAGDERAVAVYVERYRLLTRSLLKAAAWARPDVIEFDPAEGPLLLDADGRRGGAVVSVLDESASQAPFSPWSAALGVRDGVAMHALASLREMMPGAEPLELPVEKVKVVHISAASAQRFLSAVRRHLNAADEPELERVRQTLGLSYTELGGLFGVSRQGVKDWIERGLPSERQEKVSAVAALCDLLERKLKTDRIPGVARRPAEAYGGKTMLDLITADRHRELLDLTRRSFDWATAA